MGGQLKLPFARLGWGVSEGRSVDVNEVKLTLKFVTCWLRWDALMN